MSNFVLVLVYCLEWNVCDKFSTDQMHSAPPVCDMWIPQVMKLSVTLMGMEIKLQAFSVPTLDGVCPLHSSVTYPPQYYWT
jgi:hypothetical protein